MTMYAISFDMTIADLRQHYGEPYQGAYWEIKQMLSEHGFYWVQGSTYMTDSNDLSRLFRAIYALKNINWFRLSVRDIRGYKVEDWSDFTALVKEG